MSKTWLSVATAVALVAASVGIFSAHRAVLGPEASGPLGWKVTVAVAGTLLARDSSISVVRPLDFRRQHITEERLSSGPELREPVKRKRSGQRMHTWRRSNNASDRAAFHLEYSFLCSLRSSTPGMERITLREDAPAAAEAARKPSPGIESEHAEVARVAAEQAGDDVSPAEQARALFSYVAGLATDRPAEVPTALACLRGRAGDALGKARLLAALCRNRDIPTRILSGLIFADAADHQPHIWAEAWLEGRWVPMDPTYGHFGVAAFPENYLVMRLGDGPLVVARAAQVRATYLIENLHPHGEANYAPSPARTFWRRISLQSLHVSEQHMVEFLLLLPVASLIVAIARTIIGIKTFGIFAPRSSGWRSSI